MTTAVKDKLDKLVGYAPDGKNVMPIQCDPTLERELYVAVVSATITECMKIQGIRVRQAPDWWKANMEQAVALAEIVVEAYHNRK